MLKVYEPCHQPASNSEKSRPFISPLPSTHMVDESFIDRQGGRQAGLPSYYLSYTHLVDESFIGFVDVEP